MKKSLLVKYLYKGKVFSVVFSGGQRNKHFLIGKKLIIGSDPKIFWQIFNDSFPKTHDLIVKEDDKHYFNLLSSFNLEVKKNNQVLELNDLKNLGILKNNKLFLSDDMEGKITVDQNTEFSFQYITIKETLSDEEKKLVALFHQWPKATGQEKFTKYSISILVLFILVLATIIGWNYVPPKKSTVFDRAEREITILTELELKVAPSDESFDDTSADEAEEVIEESDGDAKKRVDANQKNQINTRQQARMKDRQSKASAGKAGRYQGIAGGGGGGSSSATGTGSGLAVKSRISGLKGGSRQQDSGFRGLEVDTGSGYQEMADRLRRQKDDQLNSAAISSRGVRASELGGRKTTGLSASGDVDLEALTNTLGDGTVSIRELGVTAVAGDDIAMGSVEVIDNAPKINLSDAQKEGHLKEWFVSRLNLQITEKFNTFKLRKPMKGELMFRFVFRDDKIVSIKITGQGSIGDKEFTKALEDMIKNKRCPNIGDYSGNVKQYYE